MCTKHAALLCCPQHVRGEVSILAGYERAAAHRRRTRASSYDSGHSTRQRVLNSGISSPLSRVSCSTISLSASTVSKPPLVTLSADIVNAAIGLIAHSLICHLVAGKLVLMLPPRIAGAAPCSPLLSEQACISVHVHQILRAQLLQTLAQSGLDEAVLVSHALARSCIRGLRQHPRGELAQVRHIVAMDPRTDRPLERFKHVHSKQLHSLFRGTAAVACVWSVSTRGACGYSFLVWF